VTHSGIEPFPAESRGIWQDAPRGGQQYREGKRQNRRIDSIIDCAMDIKEGFKPFPGRITHVVLDMEFDHNRADIKARYRNELAKVAEFLTENPNARQR